MIINCWCHFAWPIFLGSRGVLLSNFPILPHFLLLSHFDFGSFFRSEIWCDYNRMKLTCDMMVMIWIVTHEVWSYILFFPFNFLWFFFCVHMYSIVMFIWSSSKVCFEWHDTVVGWYQGYLIFYLTFIFLTLQYLRAPPS